MLTVGPRYWVQYKTTKKAWLCFTTLIITNILGFEFTDHLDADIMSSVFFMSVEEDIDSS